MNLLNGILAVTDQKIEDQFGLNKHGSFGKKIHATQQKFSHIKLLMAARSSSSGVVLGISKENWRE
jgi:hypothetical protein